jgi:hypothetical protein
MEQLSYGSGFNDHFNLNLGVKREEMVEFGPLGYSRQEIVGRKQGFIHLSLIFTLILHVDAEELVSI